MQTQITSLPFVKTHADTVILSRRSYDRLMRDLICTRQEALRRRAEDNVLAIVREGEEAFRRGKTIIARSSRDAIRKWPGR